MSITYELGLKSDPILYRYSYDWLFKLLAEEGVRHVQLGTFFELYQLPDQYWVELRAKAKDHGIQISSVFTAHRELGGWFIDDTWAAVARKNTERLIEVAGLLGARAAGHNPGAVPRDKMSTKGAGWNRYIHHAKELMHYAFTKGVPELTIEPMSCLAEPPTLPAEQRELMEILTAHHAAHANTSAVGYCIDIAHGYADVNKQIVVDHVGLLEAGLPWCREIHLKNTDPLYDKTFGFSEDERKKGIIDVAQTRAWLDAHASVLPVKNLVGYLEMGGPKLGRDYSDPQLGDLLRVSLRHLKQAWLNEAPAAAVAKAAAPAVTVQTPAPVKLAPSIMCADQLNLGAALSALEGVGCDQIHVDVMDAHFTPNLPLGLETIKAMSKGTSLPLDVHLMVNDADFFIRQAKECGARFVSIQIESVRHLDRSLALIRDLGMRAGVALNPATPLDALKYVLPRIDAVMLMTVNPGFAGQPLVPTALAKIADTRDFLQNLADRAIPIAVDGNVSFVNIPKMVAAGADELILGSSSLYHRDGTLAQNAAKIRSLVSEGLAARTRKATA